MNERLCVVLPVYNERDAIAGVLRKWSAALDAIGIDYAIRPYNDGSKDDSLAVLRAAAQDLPRVDVRDKPNGARTRRSSTRGCPSLRVRTDSAGRSSP